MPTFSLALCSPLGLAVQIIILLHESQEWRKLVREEGELWRGLSREIVHDIGFI